MNNTIRSILLPLGLSLGMLSGAQAGLMDNLKNAASSQLGSQSSTSASTASSSSSLLGGLGLPSMSSSTSSNAAGVLQYCIKNKYLSASSAEGVKASLLSKVGLGSEEKTTQDEGYQSGVSGILKGSDGSSFSLDNVQSKLKSKACDYVLDNAKSFL